MRAAPAQPFQLVLGVLATEHQQLRRSRSRTWYNSSFQRCGGGTYLVRFVLSSEWVAEQAAVLREDEVAVSTGQARWTRGAGIVKLRCTREVIMVRKV